MVIISNLIVFTSCLSNSILFTFCTPLRAFRWLDYTHCTTTKSNGWPGYRAGQFGVHHFGGRQISRTGEGIPGAVVTYISYPSSASKYVCNGPYLKKF